MISFTRQSDKLTLEYVGEYPSSSWVYQELKEKKRVTISTAFHFTQAQLITAFEEDAFDNSVEFKVAILEGDYFRFSKEILSLDHDLFIHQNIKLERKFFVAERNISIFPKIDALVNQPIYIGGEQEDAIPEGVYRKLLKDFPNSTELSKYASARIDSVISGHVETKNDFEEKYQHYLNNKPSIKGGDPIKVFSEFELLKYESLLEKLTSMLDSNESKYTEKQWQEEILQIVQLLYPKYIKVFKEAPVRDTYNNKDRSIDFLLVDANGNTDIIEIKKPFNKCIVTNRTYRDNFIPLKELSGTVMQIEKYIYYLNKWGRLGESKLTEKYKSYLPSGFEINITNPSGMIIMGRSKGLTKVQLQDFEVIKRKYKNVIDIITYDDLLQRLEFMIQSWRDKAAEQASSGLIMPTNAN